MRAGPLLIGVALLPQLAAGQESATAWQHRALSVEAGLDGVVVASRNPWLEPRTFVWEENLAALDATLEIGQHLALSAGASLATTIGSDPQALPGAAGSAGEGGNPPSGPLSATRAQLRLDELSLGLEHLGGGTLSVRLGRHGLVMGEGFLVADGAREVGARGDGPQLGGEETSASTPAQHLGGLSPWDGVSARLELPDRSLAATWLLARVDASVAATAELPPRPEDVSGLMSALDVEWIGGRLYFGGTTLGLVTNNERGMTAAGRGVASWGQGWSLSAEGALQVERREELPARAQAWRVSVTRRARDHAGQPWVTAGGALYSGDRADTADRDEVYVSRFHDPDGALRPGDLAGRTLLGLGDLRLVEVSAGLTPRLDHHLSAHLYTLLSDEGTGVCEGWTGWTSCAPPESAAVPMGPSAPLLQELDLRWAWEPPLWERHLGLGADLAVAHTLPAAAQVLPSRWATQAALSARLVW